jgi:hypothetical protein
MPVRTRAGILGAVQHFESGNCPNCPNRDDAGRAVHGALTYYFNHRIHTRAIGLMSCCVHRTRQQRRVAHGGPADWMGRRLRGTCLQIEQVEQVRQVQQVEDSYYFNSRTSMGDWTDVVSCFVYSQGASYDPSGMNYRCPCCDKQTRTMQASFLLLHVRAGD